MECQMKIYLGKFKTLTLFSICFGFLKGKRKKSSSYLNFFYLVVTINQNQKPAQSAGGVFFSNE